MPILSIIVAVDENDAIGKSNQLLCYLPADLKYFKSVTQGHTILMGRKTFESLPNGALPKRRNIVITRNQELCPERAEACLSLEEGLLLTATEDEVFIIGGGSVYADAMRLADRLYITRIHHAFDAPDTYFPLVDEEDWTLVSEEKHAADEKNAYDYSFLVFERK